MKKGLMALIAVLFVLSVGTVVFSFSGNLTGVWMDNDNGGIYYIRQIGNDIYWYGEKNTVNPNWTNVAKGTISGNKTMLNWADVPKGQATNGGTLTLLIVSDNELIKENATGGFGTKKLTR